MKKIGIIGAMDVEVERLKADMTVTRQITKAQMHFCAGNFKESAGCGRAQWNRKGKCSCVYADPCG